MESKNYKFSKVKSEGLTYLWVDGKRVAATGTIRQLLDCGALLKVPKGVPTTMWIIIDIQKGEGDQQTMLYADGAAARVGMLARYVPEYWVYTCPLIKGRGFATLRDLRETLVAAGHALLEDGLQEGRDYTIEHRA